MKLYRHGLTLIELVIVLLILVALAGILIPNFTGVPGQAHGSAGADNVKEIVKAINLHEVQTGGQPAGYDTLVEAGTTNPFDGLPGINATGDGFNAPHALTDPATYTNLATTIGGGIAAQDILDSLATVGITTLSPMAAAPGNSTFGVNSGAAAAPAAGDGVVTLSAAGVTTLGLPAGETYAVFGLGEQCTLIGTSVADAPLHFPEGQGTPENEYARWLLVYQLTSNGALREKARFVSVFALEDDGGASGLQGHLAEFFESRN